MCGVQRKSAPFIVFCALQISKNRVKMSCHDILSRIHVKLGYPLLSVNKVKKCSIIMRNLRDLT